MQERSTTPTMTTTTREHQPLSSKLSPVAGVNTSNSASSQRIPSLQHRVTPIAKMDTGTDLLAAHHDEPPSTRRTSAVRRNMGANSALNSFLQPAGTNEKVEQSERVARRTSPPKLDRSTAKNIITAHINQMIGNPEFPDANHSQSSSEQFDSAPKSPTYKVSRQIF